MRSLTRINPALAAAGGLILGFTIALAIPAVAQLSAAPNTFQSGETTSASEVNENFQVLSQAVNDLSQQVSDLQEENTDLQAKIDQLEEGHIFALSEHLTVYDESPVDTAVEAPIIRMTGANLQVVNGAEEQRTPDGTGNLIVGFAQARSSGDAVCSDGQHGNEGSCTGEWAIAHNSGSHNIVGGDEAAYSQTGGLVVGIQNVINREAATVSGGLENTASGEVSAVSGGGFNTASGIGSSVTGGVENTASGGGSSVTGGEENTASGGSSSVSGGNNCELTGSYEWGALNLGDC